MKKVYPAMSCLSMNQMVAGDTNRRSYNASSFADQAVSFVCLGMIVNCIGVN